MTGLCAVLTLFVALPVDYVPVEGPVARGELHALSDAGMTVTDARGERTTIPLETLRSIRLSTSDSASDSAPGLTLTLSDGSRLSIHDVRATAGDVQVRWGAADAPWLTVPRRQIRAVRLQVTEGALAQQWQTLLSEQTNADRVIVPRGDSELQAIDGILGEIDADRVRFEFDKEWINVRRTKPYGLIYFTPDAKQTFSPRAQVTCRDGSRLQLAGFRLQDDVLQVTTPNGLDLALPVSRLDRIDLELVSIVYLSDLEPERMEHEPRLTIPMLSELEQQWFAPRRDRRVNGEPFKLPRGDSFDQYAKGLGLHSQTELVYRTAGDFRRFQAIAALDRTDGLAEAKLIIHADGKPIHEMVFDGSSAPQKIDLDISGVNRLTIEVAYGDRSEMGDHLSLCDAKFLK